MRLARLAAVTGVALAAAFAGSARFDSEASADTPPTAWEKAKDPAAGARFALHVKVLELLWQSLHADGRGRANPMRTLLLESARAQLEEADAAASPDVRLRFDLGDVYYQLDRYQEALAVLRPALAMAPTHSAAPGAWLDLAYAAAKLDLSTLELDGYDHYLATVISTRADLFSVLSNRAEAQMRLGNLDAAVEGYRAVVDQAEHVYGVEPQTIALARWGLAVALDRDDDAAGAEHEAALAVARDPEEEYIGDQENVFFVPAYEREWYFALGRTVHAKQAVNPRRALACWKLVVEDWSNYLGRAAKGDRWVPLARVHLESAEAEMRAAAARFAKTKPEAPLPSLPALRALRAQERPC